MRVCDRCAAPIDEDGEAWARIAPFGDNVDLCGKCNGLLYKWIKKE